MTLPPDALKFLRRVLPEQGYKCAVVVKPNGSKWHSFFATHEELLAFLLLQDGLGLTTYHACATFKVPQNNDPATPHKDRRLGRTQHNALAAQALWADVDAGEGKPYENAAAAYRACEDFCLASGMPRPIYVASGNGLHTYWPLAEVLDPAAWTRAAAALKLLHQKHGLLVDPVRTADITSILRTPGTHHRKFEPLIVRAGELVGPYRLEDLPLPLVESVAPPSKSNTKGASLVSAALNIYQNDPSFAEPIARQCAQIGALRESAGNLPEPVWYAALGVLTHCEDGETFAHEWSAGFAGYTHEETQARLDRANEFAPVTCAHFQSVNAATCEGCPLRGTITTPLQLGRSRAAQTKTDTAAGLFSSAPPQETDLPPLPPGYVWRGRSLVFASEKKGAPVDELISRHPIYLDSVQVGEIADSRFALAFQIELPHEGWKEINVSAADFFSSSGMSTLAGQGAVIHDADLFKKYVREAMDIFHAENNLDRQYDQFGWKYDEQAFLFGKYLYTANSVTPVVGSPEVRQRSQWLTPRKGASLEAWSNAASSLFAVGCEAQSFALLASFAAPLMRFHSTTEGGAIISLLSRGSGTGKSTSLAAVASVWGLDKGLALTNIDTKVSKGLTLGVLGNLPIIYDELTNKDPSIIHEFVLVFTNGRDKMRGTADGAIRHTQASWQTLLISASNTSLVDVLIGEGTDAPAFRVLEFDAKLPAGIHRGGDALKKQLEGNCGVAGDAYMRYLVQPEVLAWVKETLPAWTQAIWERGQFESHHRFWVRTLASVSVAAHIVRKMNLLAFDPDRIVKWALDQMTERRGVILAHGSVEEYHSLIGEFLNEHVSEILVARGPYKPKMPSQPMTRLMHRIVARYELEGARLLISEAALRTWLHSKGVGYRDMINTLKADNTIVSPRRLATLSAGTDIVGGQIPCVEIHGSHPALTGVAQSLDSLDASLIREGVSSVPLAKFPKASA